MERKSYKKFTIQEIKAIRKMFQDGLSLSKIGRIFKRDHTSIGYWVRIYKKNGIKKERGYPKLEIPERSKAPKIERSDPKFLADKDLITFYERKTAETDLRVQDFQKQRQEEREEEAINIVLEEESKTESEDCVVCKKEKTDSRWKKTRYCSMKCWDSTYEKK